MIAITGASGFIGSALLRAWGSEARGVSRRTGVDVEDVDALTRAFQGYAAVVHVAGINREIGDQTFDRVHVRGTRSVIAAAKRAGVRRIVLVSYLRARPNCGSPYHETKWAAEEMVRASGLDHAIIKPGIVFGRGDHLVDHLTRTAGTIPVFATVGLRQQPIAPVRVEDLVTVLSAAARGELDGKTVAVTGPETLSLATAMRRVARITGRRVLIFPLPTAFHRALAAVTEQVMTIPLLARAQARMLAEGVVDPATPVTALPEHLRPRVGFTDDAINAALPTVRRFARTDLRCARSAVRA